MPLQPVPYLIVAQELAVPTTLGTNFELKIFVCFNLLDHRAVGIALSRDDSLQAMERAFAELNDGGASPPGAGLLSMN